MTGRIRLATPAQIVVLTLAWLGVCLGIDFTLNRHLWAGTAPEAPSTVPLSVRLHHLRCKGCPEEVKQSLAALPWLQGASMTVRETGAETAPGDFAGWLDIVVAEPANIDFVALDQALRKDGFVASQIQFGGVRHFRLEGQVRHLCSPTTQGDCEPLPDLGKNRTEELQWLDSLSTDAGGSTVVFHVRYQQPTDRIDVKALLTAMDGFGLPPSSLRVVATPEG